MRSARSHDVEVLVEEPEHHMCAGGLVASADVPNAIARASRRRIRHEIHTTVVGRNLERDAPVVTGARPELRTRHGPGSHARTEEAHASDRAIGQLVEGNETENWLGVRDGIRNWLMTAA